MPSGKQQTTTSTSSPWSGAQPALTQGLKEAQNLYSSGVGGQVYTGSTAVPYDIQTTNAMGGIAGNAYSNVGGKGISGQFQNIINNGGYNPAQMSALKNTTAAANSTFNPNDNPAFANVLKQATDAATNSVNDNASAAGRYGSGTNQQLLATNVGNVAGQLTNNEYNNWQNRRDAANSNLFNMGQTAQGNLGNAYNGINMPLNDIMKLGSMNEDLATRQMNDRLRIFDAQQNAPWQNLSRLNAIASGAGQLGGTTTTSQPGQNPFLTALGYGSTGLGILGSL